MSIYSLFALLSLISLSITAPSCIDNQNFCKKCNVFTNLCFKCKKPEILVPDKNGGCIGSKKCIPGKNYCNECDENGNMCKVCEENYYPDENGGCAYSKGCEISYMGECLKCQKDFALIGKDKEFKFCKSLSIDDFKGCAEINYKTGFCATCEEGFYLTSADKKCIKTENCKESIFGNCISCNKDFYFNKEKEKCVEKGIDFTFCEESIDGQKCEKCEDGYYPDENGICVQTQFCSKSENLKCVQCKKGYYLTNYNICTETENCDFADKMTSICTYCKNGYYLDTKDYKCKSNTKDDPFKFCQKAGNDACLSCQTHYYLGQDLKCSNTDYCSESENGICVLCQDNYHLGKDNICTNVDKCIYSKFGLCIECEEGYYYDKINKKCVKMEGNFLNCKYSCDAEEKCCECKDGFYIFVNDSLCYDNTKEKGLSKCASVDSSKEKCNRCAKGYYLTSVDQKCSQVEKCKKVDNENNCIECDNFYCLDVKKQVCVNNDFLENGESKFYIACNRTNEKGTACEKCIDGYQLNDDGYCQDIDICVEKKGGVCTKCKDIMSPNNYHFCANKLFGCLEISQDNCLRCDNLENLYECTECEKGYRKEGERCIKDD